MIDRRERDDRSRWSESLHRASDYPWLRINNRCVGMARNHRSFLVRKGSEAGTWESERKGDAKLCDVCVSNLRTKLVDSLWSLRLSRSRAPSFRYFEQWEFLRGAFCSVCCHKYLCSVNAADARSANRRSLRVCCFVANRSNGLSILARRATNRLRFR